MKMKLKQLLAVTMITASLTAMAPSTFAATGVGDSQNEAIALIPGEFPELHLSSHDDVDWYKWTNTTGKNHLMNVSLMNHNAYSTVEYRFGVVIKYADGRQTNKQYAPPVDSQGRSKAVTNLQVPNGATVYFVVESEQFDAGVYYIPFSVTPVAK
ncbi:hypothetical protein [Paenibacillus sp. 481]|uniref:hypothetical protein n=1 Tax=Paenibacillus sp. 481 TaxID=2835869 RepID=UPI001E5FD2AA|nr:hypothetical protein [Paenibacillus sp. 481]UHA73673.1 hypothetical protein KIK04_00395 [Paenibacillus sp. 481]